MLEGVSASASIRDSEFRFHGSWGGSGVTSECHDPIGRRLKSGNSIFSTLFPRLAVVAMRTTIVDVVVVCIESGFRVRNSVGKYSMRSEWGGVDRSA